MKNRLEYKYLVPLSLMDRLRADLLKYLDHDGYALKRPNREYTVRSIYLDTHGYRCYYEKLDGLHTRRKYRIRGYNRPEDNHQIFFEIKHKYDNFISKSRAGFYFKDLHEILQNNKNTPSLLEKEADDYEYFYYHYQMRRLEPKVLVVYDREPFECKFGSQLRITFDKNLRSKSVDNYLQLFDDDKLLDVYRREFVFEVKFFQVLPQWINRVLGKYDLTRLAVSKYTSSIERQGPAVLRMNTFVRTDNY
jgi:SPX domain protein involved in polyphosphate accumulation